MAVIYPQSLKTKQQQNRETKRIFEELRHQSAIRIKPVKTELFAQVTDNDVFGLFNSSDIVL